MLGREIAQLEMRLEDLEENLGEQIVRAQETGHRTVPTATKCPARCRRQPFAPEPSSLLASLRPAAGFGYGLNLEFRVHSN